MTAAVSAPLAPTRAVVVCPAVLDLAYAPELKEVLLSAIAEGGDVEVRAEAVTHADTANLQVLCAAAAELARAGRTLTVEPSEALVRVARRLGLVSVLGAANLECWAGAADPTRTTGQ